MITRKDIEKIKNILIDVWKTNEFYEDVMYELRTLKANDEITDEEYEYILKNYDELLEKYLIL